MNKDLSDIDLSKIKEILIYGIYGYHDFMSMVKEKIFNETYIPPDRKEVEDRYLNDPLFYNTVNRMYQGIIDVLKDK